MDQVVFNWGFTLAGIFGGWILKVIWEAIVELKKDVREIDTKMHEDFVRREDFKDAIKEIKDDMKSGFNKIDSTLGLIFKKLDNKQNVE